MIGTLTNPTTPPLRFHGFPLPTTSTSRSVGKMPSTLHKSCIISLHAVAEPPPAVETRRIPATLYDILQVNRNASPVEIKAAYRTLAKMYHPDASDSESDGRDFMKIHNAYTTLSDPSARAMYDMTLRLGSGGRSFGQQAGFYTTRRWETDQCW